MQTEGAHCNSRTPASEPGQKALPSFRDTLARHFGTCGLCLWACCALHLLASHSSSNRQHLRLPSGRQRSVEQTLSPAPANANPKLETLLNVSGANCAGILHMLDEKGTQCKVRIKIHSWQASFGQQHCLSRNIPSQLRDGVARPFDFPLRLLVLPLDGRMFREASSVVCINSLSAVGLRLTNDGDTQLTAVKRRFWISAPGVPESGCRAMPKAYRQLKPQNGRPWPLTVGSRP